MRFFKTAAVFLLAAIAVIAALDRFYPPDFTKLSDLSPIVKDRDDRWLYAATNADEKWRFRADLTRMDPKFIEMLLNFEDRRFYGHSGMDPIAMSRAVWQMLSRGRVVSGGSTITMQLARLLEPKKRSIVSKITEIFRAFQIEARMNKSEILSAYLTLAPYGGNIEGVTAASIRYFGKLPSSLSAAESALLISLPQSPERNRPDRHPEQAEKNRKKVLTISKESGIISKTIYAQALQVPIPRELRPFPRHAPHLSSKLAGRRGLGREEAVKTTINRDLQISLERWAKNKDKTLPAGATIAVLVLRNDDSSVAAYLGSHYLFSRKVPGFVDMLSAVRSPGSALKPFIYAMAFEKHLLHPNTIVSDEQTRFGDYVPHNFTNGFTGEVTAADALKSSLNIPAVKILERMGAGEFVESLESLCGRVCIPGGKATLPVALGGIGISMLQMGQLYAALANGGSAYALRYLDENAGSQRPKKLISPKAAKMTTAILRSLPEPEGFIDNAKNIAYKTGTSYGFRDAWTAAYDKSHTVIVWTGRPDNSPLPKRSGRRAAAPLAYEVFTIVNEAEAHSNWGWPHNYLGGEVPQGLKYFEAPKKRKSSGGISLLYPADGTRFKSAECSDVYIGIKAQNGSRPYYWHIDGEAMEISGASATLPFGHGAHRITVMDSNGDMASSDIWVERPEC